MQVCAGALNEKCGHKRYFSGLDPGVQDSELGDTCAPGLRKDFDISVLYHHLD